MKHQPVVYKNGFIYDQDGNQLIGMVAVNCSKKYRDMAGKELANKLNTIYRGQPKKEDK